MPDPITPNQSGAQASATQPVNPSQPTGSEAGAQSQQASAPDLLSEMKKLFDDFKREQQSQRDKLEARINNRVARPEPAAQSAQPSETQSRPAEGTEPPQAAATSSQQPAQEANPLDVLANKIMDTEGIDIDQGDPEEKMVDWTNEATVARTLPKAIDAKRLRAAAGSLPLTNGTPVANPIANITNLDDLWQRSRQKGR